MFSETDPSGPDPELDMHAGEREPEDESLWSAYWERFRRQQVDDPVEERREGPWERFRRQEVDHPVRRRDTGRSGVNPHETR
jgi:hypothetical protein